MTMFMLGVVVSIVTGLLVNEFCDLSPWLARKIIHRSAHAWAMGDADLAAMYAEEWAAIIEDCPGKLTKLGWALRFAAGAARKVGASRLRSFVQAQARPLEIARLIALGIGALLMGIQMLDRMVSQGVPALVIIGALALPVVGHFLIEGIARLRRGKQKQPANRRWPWWPF